MAAKRSFDRVIFSVVIFLTAGGLLMIYSASAVIAQREHGDPYHFLKRQVVAMLVGFAGMAVLMRIDYRRLQHPVLARGALLATLGLLVMALASPPVNGTHRWVILGGQSLQPSELAKLALLIFLADVVSRHPTEISDLKGPLLGCLLASGVTVALTAVQPDLGTALSIATIACVVLFAAGLKWRYILVPGIAILLLGILMVSTIGYQKRRIETFLNPDADPAGAGYQVRQSRLAIASGGVLGRGLGEGAQKLFFLPYPHTDFIFSNIAEELGIVGTMTIVAAFLVLLARGLIVAARAPNLYLSLVACGVTMMLVGQAFINMGVCMGILPAKGLPLPFMSYGGSSLVTSLLASGLLLNASQHVR
jgi:cell division protein FtsW